MRGHLLLAAQPHWTVETYNVLLNMYGKLNNPQKLQEVYDKMKRENVEPNDVTFGTLVTAFARWKGGGGHGGGSCAKR